MAFLSLIVMRTISEPATASWSICATVALMFAVGVLAADVDSIYVRAVHFVYK